jgi:cysteine synthase A
MKTARPNLKVIATEPEQASLLAGGEWAPHKIQGWTPDFIPDVLDREVVDQVVPVNEDESMANSLLLARQEGIFTGISGGATLTAALKIADQAEAGSVILAMLPDTAERYMTTPLFASINEGSDDDWLASL